GPPGRATESGACSRGNVGCRPMGETVVVEQRRWQTAQLWTGTVAALLAVALPVTAAVISGVDTSDSFRADNAGVLADHEQRERLAATLHVIGQLATVDLIGLAPARPRCAYPLFGTAAAGVLLLDGAVFALLRR